MAPETSSVASASRTQKQKSKRTRAGCLTCRRDAKVRCDQQHPICVRCGRLGLSCRWDDAPISLKERRRLAAEKWATAPKLLQPATKIPATDFSTFVAAGQDVLETWDIVKFNLDFGSTQPTDAYASSENRSSVRDNTVFADISLPDDLFDPSFLDLGADMILGTETVFTTLPSLATLTQTDHQALMHFQQEALFGFGNKSPAWSTHAILLQSMAQQPMVLHLLLAASLAEISWRQANPNDMVRDSEKHYQLGHALLLSSIELASETDELAMLTSFWFLHLHQRRRRSKQFTASARLSVMAREYVSKHRLIHAFSKPTTTVTASITARSDSPQRQSLVARLLTWLFWMDVQSGFQGEGGHLARLLFEAPVVPKLDAPVAMNVFEHSRPALELYWGQNYPDSELADDLENGGALELLHSTWVIVQEINVATESGALDTGVSQAIKTKIDGLRNRFPFSTVFRLSESASMMRHRLIANADWAVCNYYALYIYHFRCSIGDARTEVGEAFQGVEGLEQVVASLLSLIQKTLAANEAGQLDRLQWPLFWAGIETSDAIYRDWILLKLTNTGLQSALKIVLLEQSGVGRLSISRIRRICQDKCTG